MAITPRTEDDAFLREVDEGVRADQLASFWRSYGRWLVIGLVVFLASLGGWLWWQGEQLRRAGVAGEDFTQALSKLEVGDTPAAQPVLDRLAAEGPNGYTALATLTLAGNAVTAGDTAKAITLFDRVAADSSAAEPLRDVATIKSARLRFDDASPADTIKRLAPLAVPGNPWFSLAGEMTALAKLKAGDNAGAKILLTAIARDPATPPGLRDRTGQLAVSLGVDPRMLAPQTAAPAQ